jgi:hypothetical protein
MKERPILFSGPMVRAILEGRKTMTRRVINTGRFDQATWDISSTSDGGGIFRLSKDDIVFNTPCGMPAKSMQDKIIRCPYGQPGDRLWVKETTVKVEDWGYQGPVYLESETGRQVVEDGLSPGWDDMTEVEPDEIKLRPSIYMTRSMARILLDITDVRVERVQDISDGDVAREGVAWSSMQLGNRHGSPARDAFADLWDSINAKRGYGWDANPWVWVIEFKRHE